jgi:hypothetical protein
MTPKYILSGIAIIVAVAGLIWPNNSLVAISVVLVAVANFLP